MTLTHIEIGLFVIMAVISLVFSFWLLRSAAKHEREVKKLGEEIEAKTGLRVNK